MALFFPPFSPFGAEDGARQAEPHARLEEEVVLTATCRNRPSGKGSGCTLAIQRSTLSPGVQPPLRGMKFVGSSCWYGAGGHDGWRHGDGDDQGEDD